MSRVICLIPGDGIGPEITAATKIVLAAAGADIEWLELPAGAGALETDGDVLPEKTLKAVREHKIALKGPVTTPIGKGFTSVNVQLRQKLGLYAAVRPVRSLPSIQTPFPDIDLVVVRENTEGLYSGAETEIVPGVVVSMKVASEKAIDRIVRFAYAYARGRQRKSITVFHKANIMKRTDGLFLERARRVRDEIGEGLEYQEMIIDNGCMQLVSHPERFDVLVMENFYGDVVSDLCAGLVGGLGVVPGSNIGDDIAIFEAVHGSAPDIAGQGIANPLALIMSGVMMLNHLGETFVARRIREAYNRMLAEQNPEELTRDIGGCASTMQFAEALAKRVATTI